MDTVLPPVRPVLPLVAWRKWVLLFLIWTLPGVVALSYYRLTQVLSGASMEWGFALASTLPWWYAWALMTPFIVRLGTGFPLTRSNLFARLAGVYLPAMLVALAAHASISLLVFRVAGLHDAVSMPLLEVHFTSRMQVNALAFWTILGFHFAFDYYRKYQERERQAVLLEMQLAQANLRALKMQLNPHFLFNTLHSVSGLVRKEETQSAIKMLGRLGEFLRLALENQGVQEIRLHEELDFLTRYLEIEKIRIGDRLTVSLDIAPDTERLYVPNLILQPIVENAIHHAFGTDREASRLRIEAVREGDRLVLTVEDNGPGIAAHRQGSRGVGLSNTAERLERLYGSHQTLHIENIEPRGLRVRIRMPVQTDPRRAYHAADYA